MRRFSPFSLCRDARGVPTVGTKGSQLGCDARTGEDSNQLSAHDVLENLGVRIEGLPLVAEVGDVSLRVLGELSAFLVPARVALLNINEN